MGVVFMFVDTSTLALEVASDRSQYLSCEAGKLDLDAHWY
jgi:hypothetical protein